MVKTTSGPKVGDRVRVCCSRGIPATANLEFGEAIPYESLGRIRQIYPDKIYFDIEPGVRGNIAAWKKLVLRRDEIVGYLEYV